MNDREAPADRSFVHATALLLGEAGVLVRGTPGSGKSSLAALLIADAGRDRVFARLVGDDRIALGAAHGRLVARPHPAIAGRIERRGLGIVATPFEPACVVRLVIDLAAGATPPRHPAPEDTVVELCGIALPRLTLASPLQSQAFDLVRTRLGMI